MSYELHFVATASSPAPLRPEEIANAFTPRAGVTYRREGATVHFVNEDTGVSFAFHLPDPNAAGPTLITLRVPLLRPHTFGLEAEREARALVERFHLGVVEADPQSQVSDAYSSDTLLRGYAIANASALAALDASALADTLVLPSGTLTSAWRWNVQRAMLQRTLGEGTFVPKVISVAHRDAAKMNTAAGDAATAVVWSRFMPALLPFVDVYILVADELPRPVWVMRSDIAFVLESLPILSARFRHAGMSEEAGMAHYDARQSARLVAQIVTIARGDASATAGELPRVIPSEKVLSREITRRGSARMSFVPQLSRMPSAPMSGELWSMPAPLNALATANDVVLGTTHDRIALWERATGRMLRAGRRQAQSPEKIGSMAISADGRVLVIADAASNRVSVFEVEANGLALAFLRHVEIVRGEGHVRVVGIARNGGTIVVASESEVTLLHDRDMQQPIRFELIGTAALANDDRRVLVGAGIFDVTTGARLMDVHDKLENAVVAAFSPDDSHVVYATAKGEIAMASLARGLITLKGWIPQPAEGKIEPTSIAFVGKGTRIAITTRELVYIVDVETLTVVRIVQIGASAGVAVHDDWLYRINGSRITTEPWSGTGTSLRPDLTGANSSGSGGGGGAGTPKATAAPSPPSEDPAVARQALLTRITESLKSGKLDEAERAAKELIAAAAKAKESASANEHMLEASYQLGLIAIARDAPLDAIEPFRIASEGFVRDLGPVAPKTIMARVSHGIVLLQCEKYNDAATAFRAVIHATRNAPEVREHVVPALHHLGLALVRMGSPLLALTHLDEALTEREKEVGKDHPLYIDVELVKANALVDLGRLMDSQALIRHAARIALSLDGGGEGHPLFGEAVFAEARRVSKLGDGLRADALARRALRLAEKDAGAESFTYKDRSSRSARLRSTWRDATRLADPGGARQLCEITIRHTVRKWQPEKLAFDDSGSLPKIWYVDAPAPWAEPGTKQLRDAVKLLFATSNDELSARDPDDPSYLDVIDVDVRPIAIDELPQIEWERAWRDRAWEPSGGYVATAFGLRPITLSELGVIAIARLLVAQRLSIDEAEVQLTKRFGFDAAAAADVSNAPNDADARVVRPS